ncbi:eukaryotic translation initiation factor 2 subunit beta-like [Bidens hawaiensis]|uniref:eukaryotic translation initiation factor 2 subunit beta-like n=1 Tax=Bidens hawaiensis TaxID=980011 RepID=UPI00404B0F5E
MADENNQTEFKDAAADQLIAPFDPMKKKKKKKAVIALEDQQELVEKTDKLSVFEPTTFTGLKKKKKKTQVHADLLDVENENAEEEEDDDDDNIENRGLQSPWEGTDRDYSYEELLSRVFHILGENNTAEKRRTVLRTPEVLREGTKKTVFVNLMDICKMMHRQPEHVMTFLLAELGTSGSLDGQQRLVVKGRFAPKSFEGILRRYMNDYVICNSCKGRDTRIEKDKENRLIFLKCDKCGSERSVAQIKVGFVARVGRRKAGT